MQNLRREFSLFLLVISILLGGVARFYPAMNGVFAMNDGGLFYSMVADLRAHQFSLPFFATYNGGHIPYVYPPFGLYLAGWLARLGFSPDSLFQWLPGLLAAMSIPAFYLLARAIVGDELQAGLAGLFYAMLPAGFMWQVMGGGVTRAPGLLFALLMFFALARMYALGQLRWVFASAAFASLLTLSHPEMTYQALFIVLYFFLFWRSKRAFAHSLAVGGLTLLLTSPWWLTVILRHGLEPFQAALGAHAPGGGLTGLFFIFQFNLTGEPFMTVISSLGAFGLLAAIRRRDFFLVGWLFVSMLTDARSAPLFSGFPLAMLAAQGLDLLFSRLLLPEIPFWPKNWFALGVISILAAYLFLAASTAALRQANPNTLTEANLRTLAWVKENVPKGSRFLVLTGAHALSDPLSEWFPALTESRSLATVQGSEWSSTQGLADSIWRYNRLQDCLQQDPACLRAWDADFSYVYISRGKINEIGQAAPNISPLETLLRQSTEYVIVYESDDALIFTKPGPGFSK